MDARRLLVARIVDDNVPRLFLHYSHDINPRP